MKGVDDVERRLAEPHQVSGGHGLALSGIGTRTATTGPRGIPDAEATGRGRATGGLWENGPRPSHL
ncbi:hypothetical protein FM103_09485 [Corynebacterium xerosis]|nr:hypothetical protein FM103_09485 [Corynebacterium xerosis]